MTPKFRNFTDAFKDFRGEKWKWKNDDNSENHPMFSDDPEVRAFYSGWRLAKKGQEEILQLKKEFEFYNDRVKSVQKRLNALLGDEE